MCCIIFPQGIQRHKGWIFCPKSRDKFIPCPIGPVFSGVVLLYSILHIRQHSFNYLRAVTEFHQVFSLHCRISYCSIAYMQFEDRALSHRRLRTATHIDGVCSRSNADKYKLTSHSVVPSAAVLPVGCSLSTHVLPICCLVECSPRGLRLGVYKPHFEVLKLARCNF